MASQFGFGSGQLFGVRTDLATQSPVQFGVLQDVQIDFDGEIKELFGQYQFPVDTARGKTKITGKAKFAEISGLIYNNLFFGQTAAAGQILSASESSVLSGTSVTVSHSATFVTDLGVTLDGVPMTLVASGPASGQYAVAAGVYTFAAADDTHTVNISYTYTATGGSTLTITNKLMGTTPKFKGVFTQTYEGLTTTLTLNQCTSNKLTLPTKIDDYLIAEMDFSAFADGTGTVATLSTSN